ncbi:hypothetical protein B0T14DRAFT_268679 [Immersiella caudata]|uniref:Uncharacterized protein n=1 Tax=Immersiella caudata TaxID=314043 RepID=A0AA39WL35_9PEZI|nr:hypothetical protein B0T14DRAFT_268679 [Immersiella caudata]
MSEHPGRRRRRVAPPTIRTPRDTETSDYSRLYRTDLSQVYMAPQGLRPSNSIRQSLVPRQRGPRRELAQPIRQTARSPSASAIRNSCRPQRVLFYGERPDIDANLRHQSHLPRQRNGTSGFGAENEASYERRQRSYFINPETDVDSVVGLFSYWQEVPVYHRAIFSQRFPHSLVHSSVVDELHSEPMELPPRETRNIICPLGIVRTRQYVRLGIHNLDPEIPGQVGDFLVFDGPVPEHGPFVYLGRPFLREMLQGRLPRPLSDFLSTPSRN